LKLGTGSKRYSRYAYKLFNPIPCLCHSNILYSWRETWQ